MYLFNCFSVANRNKHIFIFILNFYKLHVPRVRTNLGKQTLKIRGVDCYNELSAAVMTQHTYQYKSFIITLS